MPRTHVLALVMAGGSGGRMQVLTEERAKPALSFAGGYRLIDFPLSNCANSGISDVWVLQQYAASPLTDHLANGRPWDLDRSLGGLKIVHPELGSTGEGWHEGNADAVYRQRTKIREAAPEVTLILSADGVYLLDYGDVVDAHVTSGAALTMVTARIPREQAGRFGVVEVDAGGRVTGFQSKPDEPQSDVVAIEVFAYDTGALLETLEAIADDADEESGLGDWSDELVPRLVEAGQVREHRFDGYWRDVGTIEAYLQGHLDLLGRRPTLSLDRRDWPLRSASVQRPPAQVLAGGSAADSLLSSGCLVAGSVERSVLSPGVVVEEGARVVESVLLDGVVVRRDACVARAILDERVEVGAGARVGEEGAGGEIAVAGAGARLEPGARLPAGDEAAVRATLGM